MQQQLIEDVLDVSRIVSGKLRLDMKSAELSKIVQDAVASVQQAADAKEIKIKVEVISGASPIICDPTAHSAGDVEPPHQRHQVQPARRRH